ncbi:16S rRNA (guanine(966)-N(2))-methyltransferase RsmD [Candidatus Saccharibacteria bacterium]|nr:16S rRNA (guanine(966)-N(2))-methyltransferase RsmD [Candidatus Saccharibacteria bacterium]
MRIVSGELKGRIFKSPKGFATHPMGDKVRTALFDTLGDISGLNILDAFGGSGALSFEAISRGAKQATILEDNRQAANVIKENISSLGLEKKVELLTVNAKTWSNQHPDQKFDIVLCDPPYNHIQENLIEKLIEHSIVNCVGVLSLPLHADIRFPKERFEIISQKTFGNARLVFYRKIA